jgi:mitofusin 2
MLGTAIHRSVDLLRNLQDINSKWPAHYPAPGSADRSVSTDMSCSTSASNMDTQPGDRSDKQKLLSNSSFGDHGEEVDDAESSKYAEQTSLEPRLISPQVAQDFFVLKLDLKLGALSQAELVHSLEKASVASLLSGKIDQSVRHLLALLARVEDVSSKVLVTGDLNAGKSTFCNALLRRKVLPEDQQPCTGIFCEVLDVRENEGVEEVHAVHKSMIYDRKNESTYTVYSLDDLENIVEETGRFTQAKIYLKDRRPDDQSLLHNGIVDISIIDAPGLNKDSVKTTAIFSRQEEIDVVVFVVSAENHFTLSAEEFICNAAEEKPYIFVVVNRFDNIRDQNRCQRLICDQLQRLSPRTAKERAELVHFVSSNCIPTGPSGNPDDGDDDNGNDKGKGKEQEMRRRQDFEHMEECLRQFVLERRSQSKLLPAKNYLHNVLLDVQALAGVNRDVAQAEIDRVTRELEELELGYEQSKQSRLQGCDDLESAIEETAQSTHDFSQSEINSAIAGLVDDDFGLVFSGYFDGFGYAANLRSAMLSQVSDAVARSEEHARECTVRGVGLISSLGTHHLGDNYSPLKFRSDLMFKKRRDALSRQIDIGIDIWDFFPTLTFPQRQEKIAGTGVAMMLVTLTGSQTFGGFRWANLALGTVRTVGFRNVRQLLLPTLLATTIGAAVYIIYQIPTSLPRRLQAKISTSLYQNNFVQINSERISSEVRRVLRYPADNLRVGLQLSVEKCAAKMEKTKNLKGESEGALKYFSNLVTDSTDLARTVEDINLEN